MDWPSLPSPALTAEPSIDELPSDFAVVSITVSDDHATMFVSRQQSGREPLVYCLPLDRQSRRDGDDAFTLEAATAELSDIIQSSDASARAARGITSREGKSDWWAARRDLDKRLGELLATIEFCWLGAFKVRLKCWQS
jgi:separase